MVIFITGATHTGKTTLARSLMERLRIPYICQDHIKMGLIRSGYTDLTPEDDEELVTYLWPVTREMAKTAIENRQDLIIEGCYFPLDWKQDMDPDYLSEIKFLCICFSEDYIKTHMREIHANACVSELRLDDSYCTAELMKRDNAHYRAGCELNSLPYILIEKDYSRDLENAVKKLFPDDAPVETIQAEKEIHDNADR